MNEIILCKLGEVVLKGLNRRSFEMKLMSNIRRRTARFGKFRIYSKQSTIYVEPTEETCDLSGAYAACKQVFGIIAIARAVPCPKEKEAILATAKTYLGAALTAARSFKVESKRADKSFPMSSIQLSQWVGGELHEAYPHLKVDVHHPELTVYVEVREDAAYVHAPAVQLEMIHFASPPYTSEQAREKVLQLARELVPWCGRLTVHVVPFAEIQEEIRRSCPEDHFTLIMRRFMMRLADALAHELGCGALVTGECLGQVASQTMAALAVSEDAATLPVLRPLIGMDKEEIVRIARHIGTFDTSILPYEDCCTVFTPRHPKTKPHVEEVREMEQALDVAGLVRRAMENRDIVKIK